jgi:hypothetical protein
MVFVVVRVNKELLEGLCEDIADRTKDFGVWSEAEAMPIVKTLPDSLWVNK